MNCFYITVVSPQTNDYRYAYAALPEFYQEGAVIEYLTPSVVKRVCSKHLVSGEYKLRVREIREIDIDWTTPVVGSMERLIFLVSTTKL